MEKICFRCHTTTASQYWKCCPRHTTEQGPDVLCEKCKDELHPEPVKHNIFEEATSRCPATKPGGWGLHSGCSFSLGHNGPHSWVVS